MDSFELNKILGAILGSCLVLLVVNFTANALFAAVNCSCNSMAPVTAFTALANSMSNPSPISLTTRPPCACTVGSRIAVRRSFNAARVPASSASIRRE